MEDDETFTEPIIVTEMVVTGYSLEFLPNAVRFTGWNQVTLPGEDGIRENRIVVRMIISIETARELLASLRRGVAREH